MQYAFPFPPEDPAEATLEPTDVPAAGTEEGDKKQAATTRKPAPLSAEGRKWAKERHGLIAKYNSTEAQY